MHRHVPPIDIAAVMSDDRILDAALNEAVRDALLDHKRTGDPIVVEQDGKIVWIPADQIQIDDSPAPPA